jgi:hypothetical protein
MQKKHFKYLLVVLFLSFAGCYSFSQGSLPSHVTTVSVPLFGDQARSGIGQLRERLTTELTDKIQTQSSLVIEQSRRDASSVIEAIIKDYKDEPSQISSASERATQNRITITVSVTYRDLVKKQTLFTQTFTSFSDYPIGDFSAQQESITETIDQVSEDILNRMLAGSGW